MSLTKILCTILFIISSTVLVENRSYNNGLVFYNLENQNPYLPPTISVSRGRGLAKFKYSPRGSIWSTFGRRCDCSGPLCGCCVGIKVKQYNFDQKMCANVSYISPKEEIQLEVFLNETSTAKYGVAARNPSPLCIPIMMGIPMSMCVQMSNIGIQGDNLNMCMDFLVRLASTELFEMHFQCMKMGLQGVGWVGSDGQPVIPSNEGKIKDKSSESNEYYDELEEEQEKEVLSLENDKENEILKDEEGGQSNNAEEELDYNDITEKIMDIVTEKEKEVLKESSEHLGYNEIENLGAQDYFKEPIVINSEESKEEIAESIKEPTVVEDINDLVTKTENDNEIINVNKENINKNNPDTVKENEIAKDEIIPQDDNKPDSLDDQTNSEEFQEDFKESEYGGNFNKQQEIFEESTSVIANEKEDTIETKTPVENNEKLQSSNGESSEIEKFEMLTNIKSEEEEVTTELTKNESELNNSLEILKLPLETTTEHFIVANLKPTVATTAATATSETNNIDNMDNAITTATTTTMTATTMKAITIDDTTAAAVATNENNNSNDSDNSQDNDSDYEDEESDEAEEENGDEEIIENKETTTINSNNENEITTDNEERIDSKETTTNAILNTNFSNKDNEGVANDQTESVIKEISNATTSHESDSNDTENHNEEDNDSDDDDDEDDENEEVEDDEQDEDEEEDEEDDEAEDSDDSDEEDEIEVTTNAIATSSLNAQNTTLTSNIHNTHLSSTDSNNPSVTNHISLDSSNSATTVSSNDSKNKSTTPHNMSQITATVAPQTVASKLLPSHRYYRRHYRQH